MSGEKYISFKINNQSFIEIVEPSNKRTIMLVSEDGYDKFSDIKNIIVNSLNGQILKDEGITDMITTFNVDNLNIDLIFHNYIDGMVTLEAICNNDLEIEKFRIIAYNIDKSMKEKERKI